MTEKERYGFDVEREMRHLKGIVENNDTLTISNRFTRYLIEQVERVQELENIIDQDARQGVIEGLYEENKRYRDALGFYANKKTYKYYKESYIDLLKDGGHTARKALETDNGDN